MQKAHQAEASAHLFISLAIGLPGLNNLYTVCPRKTKPETNNSCEKVVGCMKILYSYHLQTPLSTKLGPFNAHYRNKYPLFYDVAIMFTSLLKEENNFLVWL